MRPELSVLAGAVVILLAGLFIYQPLLFPANPDQIYPWGSDTWGHLIKADYLGGQIAQGIWYPDLFPGWYGGIQLLRYHAPLPYYLLIGLNQLTPNIWWAGNLFLFLTSVGGGLTFLLYRRWLGFLPAVAAGVLFIMLPDNLRVAFAEGNLPRALATALLPLTFYFFLRLTIFDGKRWPFLGVALCIALVVLSHAMMAAIFLVCCGLFAVVSGLLAAAPFRSVRRGILALTIGALLSAWWLLPSLTGGITEIDQQAASDALAAFPVTVSLNPLLRGGNLETYYLGFSLAAGLALAAVLWRRIEPWQRALLVTALITALVSSTVLSDLYNALPFHQLFWPIRFLSFAGFAMLLVAIGIFASLWHKRTAGHLNLYQLGAAAVLILLVIDFNPSLQLVKGREQPEDLLRFSQRLNELNGWRVATADLSHLGSAPSYLFTNPGGREQVFGWAFQGSVIAPLLARVNQSMVEGLDAYLVDRLALIGADDVVVLSQPEIPSSFGQTLESAGYRLDLKVQEMSLYHRDGVPRAYTIPHRIFGIGRGAQNLALLFPEVVVGESEYLDDYEPEFLQQFDQLFLSGFKWHNREQAEAGVLRFMEQGGERVVVDLTGVPTEALSRQPKFLDVYGETVLAVHQVELVEDGQTEQLMPFSGKYRPWITFSPQGVDDVLVGFNYPIASGNVLAVKNQGGQQIHFLGLNLIFHTLLTGDPAAMDLLEKLFQTPSGQAPIREIVPLEGYQAHQGGYRFDYQVAKETQVLVPIAHHAGTRVYIDQQAVPSRSIDQLTYVTFPAGRHRVEVRSEAVPIYHIGKLVSVLALAFAAAYTVGMPRWRKLGQFLPKREVVPHATS